MQVYKLQWGVDLALWHNDPNIMNILHDYKILNLSFIMLVQK